MPRWSTAERLERNSIPEPNSGCLLWLGSYLDNGYGQMRAGNTNTAHRVAWETANGPIPDGLHVLHKCDVRGCINVAHLKLGTRQDNMDDMVAKGRQQRGTKHALAKLSPEQVRAIRSDPRSSRLVALDHGISAGNVRSVRTGVTWRNI